MYEVKIRNHAYKMLDSGLDDGVKHKYEIFKDVLMKIK